jgi:hypothetical protein
MTDIIKINEIKQYIKINEDKTNLKVTESTNTKASLKLFSSVTQVSVIERITDTIKIVARGPAGPSSSSVFFMYAGQDLPAKKLVYSVDNKVYLASSDNINIIGRLVGITVTSALVNQQVEVQTTSIISNDTWNLSSPGLAFLGLNGDISQNGNQYILYPIGRIISNNTIFIDIGAPLLRNI